MGEDKTHWGEIASSTVGSAIPAVLGMIFGKSVDQRQMRQQQKLQGLQIQGEKQLMDYSMMKELEMWKNTGPTGQMEQYKKAGLNPALMYGMGGAGGQTIGNPQGQVTGAQAPVGGREVQDAIGMGIQMQMVNAQKDLIKAQTDNVKADTANKPKLGANIEANTANLTQGIQNSKTQQLLMESQISLQSMEYNFQQATFENRADKILAELNSAQANGEIDQATKNEKIQILKQFAIEAVLKNKNIEADTAKKIAEVSQRWKDLDIRQFEAEFRSNFPGVDASIGNLIQMIQHKMDQKSGNTVDKRPNKIH